MLKISYSYFDLFYTGLTSENEKANVIVVLVMIKDPGVGGLTNLKR